jgi:hypothetical protein
MSDQVDLVTVYRSGDSDSEDDADAVSRYLAANGLDAIVFDDDQAGVVKGSAEVRVPAHQVERAEALLPNFDPDAPLVADPSRDLDLTTIFSGMGTTAEMEAMAIKSVLEANGITCILVGDSALPNLEFQVQVPRLDEERAREILREATAAGPAAAAEAQRESELDPNAGPQA